MIGGRIRQVFRNSTDPFPTVPEIMTIPEFLDYRGVTSAAGQTVTPERSKNIATAYRCINILSDDLAKMPLQTFVSPAPGKIDRVRPNAITQNTSWLLEISPNRWMVPFNFKKLLMSWLVTWGNAYAWMPARPTSDRREIFVLPSYMTMPYYGPDGDLWYQTTFMNGDHAWLPAIEIMHLIINSVDGINGRSVIGYARESLGKQLGAYQAQGNFYYNGLSAGGILWMNGELSKDARDKVRQSYEEAMSGSGNAYRLAVLDNKVQKFEQVQMTMEDAQFLQGLAENDLEIANFFGMPLYKLNMGKQTYASNEQANLDYLNSTLDPYLVQFEETGRLRWLSESEQQNTYFRFDRDVLLRTDAETRAKTYASRIQSGQMTPNQANEAEDQAAFPGGDAHYMPANMATILSDGSLNPLTPVQQPAGPGKNKKE